MSRNIQLINFKIILFKLRYESRRNCSTVRTLLTVNITQCSSFDFLLSVKEVTEQL